MLSWRRRIAFLSGGALYFGSYEYVHDFGIKHPFIGVVGVVIMMIAGSSNKD
jgi:hypothetical protein